MHGVESIISAKLFDSLPLVERKYWSPHNGEILSGQLVAPGISPVAEHELMKKNMNSYGRTWHVCQSGGIGAPGDPLPLGEPMLAWSFNRDGKAMPGMVDARDKSFGVSTAQKRQERADLRQLAKPKAGVDAMEDKIGWSTRDIAGVAEQKATGSTPAAK